MSVLFDWGLYKFPLQSFNTNQAVPFLALERLLEAYMRGIRHRSRFYSDPPSFTSHGPSLVGCANCGIGWLIKVVVGGG